MATDRKTTRDGLSIECPACFQTTIYRRHANSTLVFRCPSCEYAERECRFTAIVDSREQHPYSFQGYSEGPADHSPKLIVPTIRKALKVGDYSILGHEDSVTIERKSKEDLYSSISQGRDNFVDRLEQMKVFAFAAIVIEGSWDNLLGNPPPHTQFAPKSLARTIQAWMIRYPGTHWLTMPSRSYAEAMTFRLLQRFWLDKQGKTD